MIIKAPVPEFGTCKVFVYHFHNGYVLIDGERYLELVVININCHILDLQH